MKEENLESNLRFIDLYVSFIKRKSNRQWSLMQKKFLDNFYKGA